MAAITDANARLWITTSRILPTQLPVLLICVMSNPDSDPASLRYPMRGRIFAGAVGPFPVSKGANLRNINTEIAGSAQVVAIELHNPTNRYVPRRRTLGDGVGHQPQEHN
jgi:hypothetical protein